MGIFSRIPAEQREAAKAARRARERGHVYHHQAVVVSSDLDVDALLSAVAAEGWSVDQMTVVTDGGQVGIVYLWRRSD